MSVVNGFRTKALLQFGGAKDCLERKWQRTQHSRLGNSTDRGLVSYSPWAAESGVTGCLSTRTHRELSSRCWGHVNTCAEK